MASSAARKPASKARPKKPRPAQPEDYDLVLYISGATEHSRSALANIKVVGDTYLKGRYRLAVVDLYQQPEEARGQRITGVPMLLKKLPLPLKRMVGDLSSEARVLIGLGLMPGPAKRNGAP